MSIISIQYGTLRGADDEDLDLIADSDRGLVSLGIYSQADPEGECAYALELTPGQARQLGRALLEAADISEVERQQEGTRAIEEE